MTADKKIGGMRGMSNRSNGNLPRTDAALPKRRGRPPEEHPPEQGEGESEELDDEPLDAGMIVDQGDGMRVIRRGPKRAADDQDSHECPDEPPAGWGEP